MSKTTKSGGVNLTSPVTVLSGVGPAKAAAYAKAGIETLEDLLLHIPRAYENRGDIRLLQDAGIDGGKSAVVLTVATTPCLSRVFAKAFTLSTLPFLKPVSLTSFTRMRLT